MTKKQGIEPRGTIAATIESVPRLIRNSGLVMAAAGLAFIFNFATSTAHAVVIASDNFESYTDGDSINNLININNGTGGSGWTQPWIGNTANVSSFAKASSGKIVGNGQSLELGVTGENRGIAVRQFAGQTGAVYIGMTLQTTNGWDGDFWQLYINDTYSTADGTTPSFSSGLLNDPFANRYFVRKGSATVGVGSTSTTTGGHTSANNDIHNYVMKVSKSAGVATDLYDQVSIWVDQATEGTPDATLGASDVGTAALNSATISTLHFRCSSLEVTDRVYLDNLKVATTYAEALQISLPGDFNSDNHVNAADYVAWRKGFAAGTLNQNDYNVWRQHFGDPPGSGTVLSSGSIPEPSAWMLLSIGLGGFAIGRNHRWAK